MASGARLAIAWLIINLVAPGFRASDTQIEIELDRLLGLDIRIRVVLPERATAASVSSSGPRGPRERLRHNVVLTAALVETNTAEKIAGSTHDDVTSFTGSFFMGEGTASSPAGETRAASDTAWMCRLPTQLASQRASGQIRGLLVSKN